MYLSTERPGQRVGGSVRLSAPKEEEPTVSGVNREGGRGGSTPHSLGFEETFQKRPPKREKK